MSRESDTPDQSSPFPIEVGFALGKVTRVFADRGDVVDFLDAENLLWAPLADSSGPARILANQFTNQVRPPVADLSNDKLEDMLRALAETHLPLSIGAGTAFVPWIRRDAEMAGMAMVLYSGVQGVNFNTNHPKYAPAHALRVFVDLFGNPEEAALHVEERRAQLERLAAEAVRIKADYEAHIEDGRTKIIAFATEAALKAPRQYWLARSEAHARKATWSRWYWLLGTALFVAAMGGALWAAFSPDMASLWPHTTGDHAWVAAIVARLVFFGTVGGVGVWLLRQFLRDVRNHEHLAEDAAERVTMIETLTALQSVGLQSADLSTILSALYRPAAAAMADDGGPVLPIEILMKGVVDAASKGKS
jgi:hypothetical protein